MSVEEKQARSVFVGNIPHGTTEEQMKEYFEDVGTVLSFRIVYDRETGNPKGYGFAEYADTEMAQCAIRNLNGREFNGRILRVDKASSQADELRQIHAATGGPPVENPYGDNVPAEKAPEAISRAVASLPPEQMYELMKQMKMCIQNNPSEARTMLLNNPQLAYALLQAQVVMRIVDPSVAQALLHRKPDTIAPIMPVMRPSMPQPVIKTQPVVPTAMPLMLPVVSAPIAAPVRPPMPQPQPLLRPSYEPSMDPRYQAAQAQAQIRQPAPQPKPQPIVQPHVAPAPSTSQAQVSPGGAQSQLSADQEKAKLIMQVLQLRDDQIAKLPPDQRQSIILLKQQIAQNTGGVIP